MRKLVLWGHRPDDYEEMFNLTSEQLGSSVLEYGCGPSAVNAILSNEGCDIISCDPLFTLDKDTLYSKTVLIFADMVEQLMSEKERYTFDREGGFENLISQRRKGLDIFFADYVKGKKQGRYQGVVEYQLPFDDFRFNYALVSHYLFAGLDEQHLDFHLEIIKELARVAKEVRIFPLIDRYGQTSPLLGPVLLGLQQENYGAEVKEVPYHLQNSGNAMLRVWAHECKLENE